MTRVERQTMYLETFRKLKDQAAESVPPYLLETWLGGAATMCLALAETDDEVTDITRELMLEFFRQTCVEI